MPFPLLLRTVSEATEDRLASHDVQCGIVVVSPLVPSQRGAAVLGHAI